MWGSQGDIRKWVIAVIDLRKEPLVITTEIKPPGLEITALESVRN